MEENLTPEISSKNKMFEELANQAREDFNKEELILDHYHKFLQAVQQNASKVHLFADEDSWIIAGKPTWNTDDTFAVWLDAVIKEIEDVKIPEIKIKKKNRGNQTGFQKLITPLVEGSNNNDRLVLDDESDLNPFEPIVYDYFEWYLHRERETIKEYLTGKFDIKVRDVEKNELDWEFGKQQAEQEGIIEKSSNLISLSGLGLDSGGMNNIDFNKKIN